MPLRIPTATYRLQFNQQFRIQDARLLVGYLQELGVTDLYASPLLQARHGSLHGYDVTDPARLNAEVGNEEEFEAMVRELHQHGMGLVLDIVPNHMAASSENPWWMDVLEDGPGSVYASYFDINWHPPRISLENKVLLPFLGRPYAEVLEAQELTLSLEQGGFFLHYYDIKLPVAPKSYVYVLQHRLEQVERQVGSEDPAFRELRGILAAISQLPERAALPSEQTVERRHRREAIKERLWNLCSTSPEVRTFVDENVRILNGKKRQAKSFLLLDRLLAEQPYVLSYWRSPNQEINYRRFFAISDLVGVRVEDPVVFEATHSVILRLVEKGMVTGLRIDHVDGLRDPLGYLRRLQERLAPEATGTQDRFYTVVEKILATGEPLPKEWPIHGTTGYDFANMVNGIFLDESGCKDVDEIYKWFLGSEVSYEDLVYKKKKQVMETLLAAEVRALGHRLGLLAEQDRYARDLPQAELTQALVKTTACLPVYRTYVRGFEMTRRDRRYIERAVETAQRRNPSLSVACFGFIRDVLLLRRKAHLSAEQGEARLAFVTRWQQLTGPIMAKGFEDSVLHEYNRLISLNEVGGDPCSPGVSVRAFHEFCHNRGERWPYTLNATSTHDTKRQEDARARINVLSEIPVEWKQCLDRWARWNEPKKPLVNGRPVPDRNEEILLYQTMLGAWPLRRQEVPAFRERLQAFMVKATREAMVYTKWTRPNTKHERALLRFVRSITDVSSKNRFLEDFLQFLEKIAYHGALNGLAQVLIKIAAPGVPDFYQGCELWDFRLVDPDNRGPVDFKKRARLLDEIKKGDREQHGAAFTSELLQRWHDGQIKLFVTHKGLNFRRAHRELFLEGDYVPVEATNNKKENICGFARRWKSVWALLVVPRLTTRLVQVGQAPVGQQVWGEDALILPERSPKNWIDVLTGQTLKASILQGELRLPLHHVFNYLPVALLEGSTSK